MTTSISDWEQPIRHRGFTRSTQGQYYLVRLYLLGAQRYVGTAKSQPEAAKIYDLALWKCAPLLPGRLKPNYPDQFPDTIQREVDTACPHINALFAVLIKSAGFAPDWDEGAAREAKLAKMKELNAPAVDVDVRNYKTYRDAVALTAAATLRTITRLTTLRLRLKLAKLPEVAKLADEYTGLLEQAELVGMKLRAQLISHEPMYRGLVAPQNDVDANRVEDDVWKE